jgi:hypothetical protein
MPRLQSRPSSLSMAALPYRTVLKIKFIPAHHCLESRVMTKSQVACAKLQGGVTLGWEWGTRLERELR